MVNSGSFTSESDRNGKTNYQQISDAANVSQSADSGDATDVASKTECSKTADNEDPATDHFEPAQNEETDNDDHKRDVDDKGSECCSPTPAPGTPGVSSTDVGDDRSKSPRKMLCLYCDRSFVSANLRQKHVERAHSTKPNRRVSARRQNQLSTTPCGYCDKLNNSEHTLNDLFRHCVQHHSTKYFGCVSCEERFLTSAHLIDHNSSKHLVDEKVDVKTSDVLPKDLIVGECVTRGKIKPKIEEEAELESKRKTKMKDIRSKKIGVKTSKIALKRSKRLQAQAKELEMQKKRRDRKQCNSNKTENNGGTRQPEKTKSACVNPYPEFDSFYRVKKITDHSIDNLKISSLTFDDVFDKAFFNRIKCNIEENLLHHIDGKLFKNEESESRISNFEKEVQNTNQENFGCELSLNAITPVASLSLSSQFGEDFESQIEYGAKPSKKKTQSKSDEVHYKYFTRRKYQASILQQKENRDLSKLDMWTQMVVKERQERMANNKKSQKEIDEYTSGHEYKNKLKREELNRILDRRGPFEDLKEELTKKAAFDKLNLSSESVISQEVFTDVREVLYDILHRVYEATKEDDLPPETNSPEVDHRQIPSFLDLRRKDGSTQEEIDKSDRIALICSSQETENFEMPTNKIRSRNELVELTGEWARSRMYICAACGGKFSNMKYLLEHKSVYHQNVWVQHYEFVGNQGELYRHLSIPGLGKVGVVEETVSCKQWKRSDSRTCTKCGKLCNLLGELHRHVLECGGDWTWMLARKKCKYRPFGAKSRRKRKGLVRRTSNKQKTDQPEKKTLKKTLDGPRQRPSDADTIQRMLANLPAKRSRRSLISLRDVVFKSRKNKERNATNQSRKMKDAKQSSVPNNSNLGSGKSLRSLNKVLSSRILDFNSSLLVKRKLKTVQGRKSVVKKSRGLAKEKPDDDESVKTETSERRKSSKKTTHPESSSDKKKTLGRKILTSRLNIKNFFPIRKKSIETLSKNSLSVEGSETISSPRGRKKNRVLADIEPSGESDYATKLQHLKTNKKGGLKGFVRALSLRKRNSRDDVNNSHSNQVVSVQSGVASKKPNRLKIKISKTAFDEEKATKKRKLHRRVNDIINKVKKTKTEKTPSQLATNARKVTQEQPFLEEKSIMLEPIPPETVVSPAEVRETIPGKKDGAPIVPILSDSKENPPIPETIFNLTNNEEKSLQAKGELDFDQKTQTKLTAFSNELPLITITTEVTVEKKEDPPVFSMDGKTLAPVIIDTSLKPKSVPMLSPSMKGKIKKPNRGLNDCIAMLTSKLQQKEEKPPSSLESLFSTSSTTSTDVRPQAENNPQPTKSQKTECILKIPTFRATKSPVVEEETALDLSKKSYDNTHNAEVKFDAIENTINRVIEGVIEHKCKEVLTEKLAAPTWPADISQAFQTSPMRKPNKKMNFITRTHVDDTIDFVVNCSSNWYDCKNTNVVMKNVPTKKSRRKKNSDDNLIKDIIFGKDKLIIAPSSNLQELPLIAKIKENEMKMQEKNALEKKLAQEVQDQVLNTIESKLEDCIKPIIKLTKDSPELTQPVIIQNINKSDKTAETPIANETALPKDKADSISSQNNDVKSNNADPSPGIVKTVDNTNESAQALPQKKKPVRKNLTRSKTKSKKNSLDKSEPPVLETNIDFVLTDQVIPNMEPVIEADFKGNVLMLETENEPIILENKLVQMTPKSLPSESDDELPLALLIKKKGNTNKIDEVESVEFSSKKDNGEIVAHLTTDSLKENDQSLSQIDNSSTTIEKIGESEKMKYAKKKRRKTKTIIKKSPITKKEKKQNDNKIVIETSKKLITEQVKENSDSVIPTSKTDQEGANKKEEICDPKMNLSKEQPDKSDDKVVSESDQQLDQFESTESTVKEPIKILINTQRTRRKSKSSKKIDKTDNDLFKDFSLVINKKTKRIPPSSIVDDSVCDDILDSSLLTKSVIENVKKLTESPESGLNDSVEEMDMEIEDIPINASIIERNEVQITTADTIDASENVIPENNASVNVPLITEGESKNNDADEEPKTDTYKEEITLDGVEKVSTPNELQISDLLDLKTTDLLSLCKEVYIDMTNNEVITAQIAVEVSSGEVLDASESIIENNSPNTEDSGFMEKSYEESSPKKKRTPRRVSKPKSDDFVSDTNKIIGNISPKIDNGDKSLKDKATEETPKKKRGRPPKYPPKPKLNVPLGNVDSTKEPCTNSNDEIVNIKNEESKLTADDGRFSKKKKTEKVSKRRSKSIASIPSMQSDSPIDDINKDMYFTTNEVPEESSTKKSSKRLSKSKSDISLAQCDNSFDTSLIKSSAEVEVTTVAYSEQDPSESGASKHDDLLDKINADSYVAMLNIQSFSDGNGELNISSNGDKIIEPTDKNRSGDESKRNSESKIDLPMEIVDTASSIDTEVVENIQNKICSESGTQTSLDSKNKSSQMDETIFEANTPDVSTETSNFINDVTIPIASTPCSDSKNDKDEEKTEQQKDEASKKKKTEKVGKRGSKSKTTLSLEHDESPIKVNDTITSTEFPEKESDFCNNDSLKKKKPDKISKLKISKYKTNAPLEKMDKFNDTIPFNLSDITTEEPPNKEEILNSLETELSEFSKTDTSPDKLDSFTDVNYVEDMMKKIEPQICLKNNATDGANDNVIPKRKPGRPQKKKKEHKILDGLFVSKKYNIESQPSDINVPLVSAGELTENKISQQDQIAPAELQEPISSPVKATPANELKIKNKKFRKSFSNVDLADSAVEPVITNSEEAAGFKSRRCRKIIDYNEENLVKQALGEVTDDLSSSKKAETSKDKRPKASMERNIEIEKIHLANYSLKVFDFEEVPTKTDIKDILSDESKETIPFYNRNTKKQNNQSNMIIENNIDTEETESIVKDINSDVQTGKISTSEELPAPEEIPVDSKQPTKETKTSKIKKGKKNSNLKEKEPDTIQIERVEAMDSSINPETTDSIEHPNFDNDLANKDVRNRRIRKTINYNEDNLEKSLIEKAIMESEVSKNSKASRDKATKKRNERISTSSKDSKVVENESNDNLSQSEETPSENIFEDLLNKPKDELQPNKNAKIVDEGPPEILKVLDTSVEEKKRKKRSRTDLNNENLRNTTERLPELLQPEVQNDGSCTIPIKETELRKWKKPRNNMDLDISNILDLYDSSDNRRSSRTRKSLTIKINENPPNTVEEERPEDTSKDLEDPSPEVNEALNPSSSVSGEKEIAVNISNIFENLNASVNMEDEILENKPLKPTVDIHNTIKKHRMKKTKTEKESDIIKEPILSECLNVDENAITEVDNTGKVDATEPQADLSPQTEEYSKHCVLKTKIKKQKTKKSKSVVSLKNVFKIFDGSLGITKPGQNIEKDDREEFSELPLTDIITSSEMDIAPVLDEIDKSLEIDDIYEFNEESNKKLVETKSRNKHKPKTKLKSDDVIMDASEEPSPTRGRSHRSAKIKALENIHEKASVLNELDSPIKKQPEWDDKPLKITIQKIPEVEETRDETGGVFDELELTEEKAQLSMEEVEYELVTEEESLLRENHKTADDNILNYIDDDLDKTDQNQMNESQELRRSRRGSRKVASYNENDLIYPLIDALEKRRSHSRKDKSAEKSSSKKDVQIHDGEPKTIPVPNNEIKSYIFEDEDISEPTHREEPSESNDDFDLEKASPEEQEKLKDIDKIYEFTDDSPDNTEEIRELFSKTKKRFQTKRDPADNVDNAVLKPEDKTNKEDQGKANYCDICKKSFIRMENLVKHKTTLTHISKLSELEAREAEARARAENSKETVEESEPSTPQILREDINITDILQQSETSTVVVQKEVSHTNSHSLNLVDIISDVLNKPVLETYTSNKASYSDISNKSDMRQYKSLAERKSFDADSQLSSISAPYIQPDISKTSILENQINLLENIIGNNLEKATVEPDNNFIDDISSCSNNSNISEVENSYVSNGSVFNVNSELISEVNNPRSDFVKPTQYEEISLDSTLAREDPKLRKILNRDEELFLECCSLLKSGSEVSNSNYSKNSKQKPAGHPVETDGCDWIHDKELIQRSEEAHEYSDNSRTPTPLGDTYDDEASNSNTISSNWNLNSEKPPAENRSFSFEEVISKEEHDSQTAISFGEMLTKGLKNQFGSSPNLQPRHYVSSSTPNCSNDEKKDDSDCSTASKKIITKGARKVFEGLKVSIPTEELNLDVLNQSPLNKKLDADKTPTGEQVISPPKSRSTRKSKPVKKSQVGSNLFFKVNKKKSSPKAPGQNDKQDVYSFEETQCSSDVFVKPASEEIKSKQDTYENYPSDNESLDYTDSNGADARSLSTVSSVSAMSFKKPEVAPENITKKKYMIMGKIFKNAAKSKMDEIDEESRNIPEIPEIDNLELVENYVRSCQNVSSPLPPPMFQPPLEELPKKPKMTEEEMNMLFDQLLGKEATDHPVSSKQPKTTPKLTIKANKNDNKHVEVKKKCTKPKNRKRTRVNSESSDDEFNINKTIRKRSNKKNNDDSGINLELELKECIGVASRKSQRKCTSGKQNVLVEYWSSDEEAFEAMLETQKIQSSKEEERKKAENKSIDVPEKVVMPPDVEDLVRESIVEKPVKSRPVQKKKIPTSKKAKIQNKKPQDPNSNSSTTLNRRKRAAANPLYHWSSSSEDESQSLIEIKPLREEDDDEEDRPIQHGWIVGDSPKKLVTMLALTKGKKTEVESVKEQGKRRTSSTVS